MARVFPFVTRDGRQALVREARPSDARVCLAIVAEAARERPRTLAVLEEELWKPRDWRKHRVPWGPYGVSLVSEIDGAVVGHLNAERGRRMVTRHSAEFGITVAAAVRGIGVGRALITTLETWAREYGVTRMALGVFPGNARAHGLYRSLGYADEGVERAGMIFPEGDQDVIRMSKRISASVPEASAPAARTHRYDENDRSRDGGG
ncbi:MAG TPA: GNAT family N-acetyltransferase [Actinomycetota bacterium]|nr:GNAT family N-acetyltransferase [Actinomycetota bacterium]